MSHHPTSSERATKSRLTILALICVATALNYADRAILGVAAPTLTAELQISPAVMGIVFSAFSWTYAAAQIPGGILLDRLGTRLTYTISLILWSAFTLMHGLAFGVVALIIFRLGLGIAEAPCFPTNSRVLATWFPQNERARANGVYSVGQYFGLAFLSPVLFWIVATWGWRSLFVLFGGTWNCLRHHLVSSLSRSRRKPVRKRSGTRAHSSRRGSELPRLKSRVFLGRRRQAHAETSDTRRLDRPILWKLHSRLLPDVVSDVSRD